MFKDSGYKAERYSKKAETDNIDALSEKLTLDLRKSIKSLGWYPVLSDSWCNMSDIFGRVAQISDMVRQVLYDLNSPLLQEAKLAQPKDGGTLWETEEQALR